MRIKLTIETRRHSRDVEPAAALRSGSAWEVITEALDRLPGASEAARERMRRWLGGAAAVYAATVGRNREEVWKEMVARQPLLDSLTDQPSVRQSEDTPIPEFRPGRSTPVPPRSPGAQRPVPAGD